MRVLNGCCWSMFHLLSLCGQYACGHDGDNIPAETLQFVAFGDWGKGGSSGDILSVSAESMTVNKGVGVLKSDSETSAASGFHMLRGYNGGGDKERRGEEDDRHEREHGGRRQEYTYQVAVAGGISSFINSSAVKTSCIIALGDNFYDDGVLTSNDSMWTTHWKEVYLNNYTELRIPWYPVFGNHDYGYGDVGAAAQLQRAKDILETSDISAGLWQFDSYNYSKCLTIPGTEDGSVCLIFIDTTTLAPSEERHCNEEGGISTDMQAARIADQLFRIEQMLIAAENSTWVVVCGHYPIYTSGEHGDSSELVTYLQPLIVKYNVSMYLAGHDHLSGHLQHEGIEYFIAGGGAMVDPLGDERSVATDVWYGVGYAAFSVLQVTKKKLSIKFIHWNGTEMYKYTLRNPRRNVTVSASVTQNPTAAPPSTGPSGNDPNSSIRFLPDVSPSLLYIAVAAGSLTGLMLSLVFFPFDKSKKKHTKRKNSGGKRKKYSSLPDTPHRAPTAPQSLSALCSPSVDTHSSGPGFSRGAFRSRTGFPLPPSPQHHLRLQLHGQRHLFARSPPRSPPPPTTPGRASHSSHSPSNRMQRGSTGGIMLQLSNNELFSLPTHELGRDHRKTKSVSEYSSEKTLNPRILQPVTPPFELGL